MSEQKKRPAQRIVAIDKQETDKKKAFITLFVAWDGKYGNMWSIDNRVTNEQLILIFEDLRKPHTERRFNLRQFSDNKATEGSKNEEASSDTTGW